MEAWPLFVVGVAVLAITLLDLLWTVIAEARGSGPVTGLVTEGLWRWGTRHGPDGSHFRLELIGYFAVVAVLVVWVVGLWAGLSLAFLSDPDAVLTTAQQPASALARAGYAAGALAGAGAAYLAGSGGWVLLNNSAAVLGLTVATLSVTYLFQVVTATTHERALSTWILGLGDCPLCIAQRGIGRSQLGSLGQHLTGLAQPLAQVSRFHLALPVVTYMHPPQRVAAIEVSVAMLDETLTILKAADQDEPGLTRPVRQAIDVYLRTVYIPRGGTRPPPAPPLDALFSDAPGGPHPQHAHEVFAKAEERRARSREVLEKTAWHWERDIYGCSNHGRD